MIWDILAFAFIAIVLGVSIIPTENQLKDALRRRAAAKRAAQGVTRS